LLLRLRTPLIHEDCLYFGPSLLEVAISLAIPINGGNNNQDNQCYQHGDQVHIVIAVITGGDFLCLDSAFHIFFHFLYRLPTIG
jgi:hypothetical protein